MEHHADVLHTLLDETARLPPEYADGLSNHLPMALHALHELGADDARLRRFAGVYGARFAGVPARPPALPVDDWTGLLGRPEAYEPLRASFARLIERDGAAATLRAVLPMLWPGVAAAAFHGLIRSAHAFQAGHAGELAAGLAYWGWRWQPLPAPFPAPARGLDFATWSRDLVDAAPSQPPRGRLISDRIEQVARGEAYLCLAGALRPQDRRLALLAGFAVERYLATRNFTLLHLVTGLWAARVLMAVAPPEAAARDALLHAVTAAYLSTGLLAHAVTPAPAAPASWHALRTAAIASDDDHVIKLVHACRQEERAYGGERYRQAAALATEAQRPALMKVA